MLRGAGLFRVVVIFERQFVSLEVHGADLAACQLLTGLSANMDYSLCAAAHEPRLRSHSSESMDVSPFDSVDA